MGPILLSVACARHYRFRTEVYHDFLAGDKAMSGLNVYLSDRLVGKIDGEGHFYYNEARNLEQALGWLLASSVGVRKVISRKSFQERLEKLRESLRGYDLSNRVLALALDSENNPFISLNLARLLITAVAQRER
ncbi:MAG: hypothetical protein Q8O88_02060 [bacterium]|nr:hypothetical protein [bacterium]